MKITVAVQLAFLLLLATRAAHIGPFIEFAYMRWFNFDFFFFFMESTIFCDDDNERPIISPYSWNEKFPKIGNYEIQKGEMRSEIKQRHFRKWSYKEILSCFFLFWKATPITASQYQSLKYDGKNTSSIKGKDRVEKWKEKWGCFVKDAEGWWNSKEKIWVHLKMSSKIYRLP